MQEAKSRLHDFYRIYDEPFYDSSGIPTSLVTEIAKQSGMKVVLSCEGGDELFGGYPSYQQYHKLGTKILGTPGVALNALRYILRSIDMRKLPIAFVNKLVRLKSLMDSKNWVEFYMRAIATQSNRSLDFGVFENPIASQSTLHPIEQFMLWDLKHLIPNDFLMKVDRATMHQGVESREPFLDHRLVEFALQLPLKYKIQNGDSKYLLKKVVERYIPKSYFERKKMGFSIPLFSWFKKDMDDLFREKLKRDRFSKAWPQIDYSFVDRNLKIYRHNKARNKDVNLIVMWKLLNLMLWHEEYG